MPCCCRCRGCCYSNCWCAAVAAARPILQMHTLSLRKLLPPLLLLLVLPGRLDACAGAACVRTACGVSACP